MQHRSIASCDQSKNVTSMPGKPRRRSLFTKVGGGPMCFSLTACPERKEIRELIERGGGVLLQPDTMPDEIRLVPSSTTAVTDSGDDVFSVDYIRACSEKNRLCPREDFKVPMPPIVPDDSKKRTPRPVRPRKEYTLGEDIAIARFIAKQPGVRIKGNAVYKEMAAAGIVPGKHSWQSLKQHYLKVIRPMRQLYESPASNPPARESRKASGSSRCDTAEQHDLVEDSQEDNFSPKHKRQAEHELEIFDGSNTKAEAVAESTATPLETPARKETKDEKRKRRSRNSSSISLIASGCERSSGTQGSLRNGWEQKAGRKGDEIKSSNHWQGLCEDPTGKLKLQTSLQRAQKRAPKRSSDNCTEAQSRQGINGSAVRTTDCKTVVGPLPARSNKQQTLPTTPKASEKGAQVHAQSVEIDSDYDFEVSPGLIKPTQGTRHRAHCSNRLKKQDSRQSLSGQLEHTPSPGNIQSPARKQGRRKLVENFIGQSSTCPKSRSNNVGTREMDFENPPALACVAEELHLPTVPSLGGCKKKGVPSPCKSREEQALLSEEQAMPSRGRRNSSRRRLREIHTSSTKGSDGVPNVDSSVTSMLYPSSAPKHRLPSSPPKERKGGMSPADRGSHSSSLAHLVSGLPEADLRDPLGCTRASENSEFQQTMKLPRKPKKRGMSSRYEQSKMTERASAMEREMKTSMETGTPSLVRKPDELTRSPKGSDSVPDAETSTISAANSTCSPECMPIQCRNLSHLPLSAGKQMGTSPTRSNSHLNAEPCLESSGNDGTPSKMNSEDPLELFYVVKGSLLRATLLREHSKASGVLSLRKGSSKEMACLEKRESSTRAKASAHRKQTRLSRPAEQGGTELAIIAMDKEEDTDVGRCDSADELLFRRATRQAPDSPVSLYSADENPLARASRPCDDNASVITKESSSECSEEAVPLVSHQDGFSRERQELARLLGSLKERRQQPPHTSAACPLGCGCPRSASYIRAGRAAVALAASLAYHDSPLPGDCPKDPRISLLLEVLLRRLEGGDTENASS